MKALDQFHMDNSILSESYPIGEAGPAAKASSIMHVHRDGLGLRSHLAGSRGPMQSRFTPLSIQTPAKVESSSPAAKARNLFISDASDLEPASASAVLSNLPRSWNFSPVKVPRGAGYVGLFHDKTKGVQPNLRQPHANGASTNTPASPTQVPSSFSAALGHSPSRANGPRIHQRSPLPATRVKAQGLRDKRATPADVIAAVGPVLQAPSALQRPQNSHAVAKNENNNRNMNRMKINQSVLHRNPRAASPML